MPITYLQGDATRPQTDGPAVLPHIVNDVGAWGAGYVLAISGRWPDVESQYRRWYADRKTNGFSLGAVQMVMVKPKPLYVIANMVAQTGLITDRKGPPIRYDALAKCLEKVAAQARKIQATVHMPRIGCALGGGRWSEVEPLIEDAMGDLGVFVYDFPGGRYNP